MRHRTDVPDAAQYFAGVGDEQRGELAVVIPRARDGSFVNFLAAFIKKQRNRRNVGVRAIQADVSLALLLGIVERMRVQETTKRTGG